MASSHGNMPKTRPLDLQKDCPEKHAPDLQDQAAASDQRVIMQISATGKQQKIRKKLIRNSLPSLCIAHHTACHMRLSWRLCSAHYHPV